MDPTTEKALKHIIGNNLPSIPTANSRVRFINMPELRSAKQRMEEARNLPPISQLFGQIWQKGELHFIFADTGAGKSILGVQIADALAKGRDVLPGIRNENEPLKIIYHDYELSDRQFFQRYSENGQDYEFSDNLFIDNLDWPLLMAENPGTPFVELIQEKIKYDVETHQAQILIIDNITFLHVHNSTDTQTALEIMRFLDSLKREFSISILVFAHCPKVALNTPITINHFAGSKMLPNFADGVSTIGKSEQAANIRYIKQIKPSRNGEMIFERDNVITLQLNTENSFLHFDFLRYESEFNHLQIKENEVDDRKLQVIDLHNGGESVREIAKITGISKSTVANWIKSHTSNE
jgi:predicted ATP-dependent serine protease